MSSKNITPSVETATTLPGEYGFISAIVSNLRDDAPKLIYSDWLEERGDPRAAFVREFVTAVRSLNKRTKLPAFRSYPRAWTNLLGVPLIRGIIEFDLVDVKDAVLRLARPIVSIATKRTRESMIMVGGSKFGGHPDLPNSVEWPTCAEGRLGFLGQIALADLKNTQVSRSLPNDGLLSFFAYQNFVSGYQPGVNEAITGDTQVLYTPGSAALTRRKSPDDLNQDGNAIFPTCRLVLCETWDLPDSEDKLPPTYTADMKPFQQRERGWQLHELRCQCHPFSHHLLGYSVHSRCPSDPSPGTDWLHLLCLDSDDNLGWSWCDGEHLAVFVHEKDVASGRFTRTYGYAS
jgi:uncharacterized protein (TIGR02996 family)